MNLSVTLSTWLHKSLKKAEALYWLNAKFIRKSSPLGGGMEKLSESPDIKVFSEKKPSFYWVFEELGLNPEFCSLGKALNLYEHWESLRQLAVTFESLKHTKFKPSWVRDWCCEYVWVNRVPFLKVVIYLEPPICLKNVAPLKHIFLFKVRDFASREIYAFDCRNLPKSRENEHFVVLAPQIADKIKTKGLTVWEIGKAFKIEGRRVKWARAKPRRFEVTYDLADFGKALLNRCLQAIRKSIEPIFELVRKLMPQTWIKIEWFLQNHDPLEWDWRLLDAPPPEREKPVGFLKGFVWKAV
jgi:hypothetical protein